MANEEQLELLKAGVEGWNKWRNENPELLIDLSKAFLNKADLTGGKISLFEMSKGNSKGAYLNGANLSGANLIEAKLFGVNFKGADLSGAFLNKADLTLANLTGANLTGANLIEANLTEANLTGAKLTGADLIGADLTEAFLDDADLTGADLIGADLRGAHLTEAKLTGACLIEVNFSGADLTGADLTGAELINSNLLQANINNVKISKSNIYGVNVWDLKGEFKEQKDLIITPPSEASITVDNIKVAQFVYLILNNKEIRDVINTLTSKTVLILGRFALPERKAIIDALRDKLREYDLLPIVFDFDRPADKDFTETIKTLASISYFVIADITNPKSSPLELQASVPDYQIPFVPIIQEGESPFAMMVDLQKKYNWVLDTISYDSLDTLIEILKPHIIDPAIKMRDKLRIIKAQEPTIISGRELKEKRGKP